MEPNEKPRTGLHTYGEHMFCDSGPTGQWGKDSSFNTLWGVIHMGKNKLVSRAPTFQHCTRPEDSVLICLYDDGSDGCNIIVIYYNFATLKVLSNLLFSPNPKKQAGKTLLVVSWMMRPWLQGMSDQPKDTCLTLELCLRLLPLCEKPSAPSWGAWRGAGRSGLWWRWPGDGWRSVAHFSDPAEGSLTRCWSPDRSLEDSCPRDTARGLWVVLGRVWPGKGMEGLSFVIMLETGVGWADELGFQFQLCHEFAVCLWTTDLTFLGLSFLSLHC